MAERPPVTLSTDEVAVLAQVVLRGLDQSIQHGGLQELEPNVPFVSAPKELSRQGRATEDHDGKAAP